MYYQTPDMREISPDYYMFGEIVQVNGDVVVAIHKDNGNYLTVLADGTDAENSEILDQEWFMTTNNKNVLIADRRRNGGACYAVTVLE